MYQKILAPLDGSELAECVVEHIKAIAIGCHVPTVVLLRVIEPFNPPGYLPREVAEATYREAKETAEVEAKNYLDHMAKTLSEEGVAVGTNIVEGLPADEILKYAETEQVDLIVMSTHGRSGVSRWLSGSVADKVLNHSFIPVLIVVPRSCRISK